MAPLFNSLLAYGDMYFEKGEWSMPHELGVHLNTLTLVPEVGPETILVLKETAEFVERIRSHGPIQLMLKAGIARTSAGPLIFIIWWFPPLSGAVPFASYELLMSPESGQTDTNLLGRAAEQSHLHFVILDEAEEILDVVEFENNYGFENLVSAASEVRLDLRTYDFHKAGKAFTQEFSLESLWTM